MSGERLRFTAPERKQIWDEAASIVESYLATVDEGRVTPELNPDKIRALLAGCDFEHPMEPLQALRLLSEGLAKYQTHTPHRRYFGLFNPAPATMGIAADALVAAFNPQMASWSHSPLAIEVESHLIRAFGGRFGYDPAHTGGTFCSGGAEANHTAVLAALTQAFPDFPRGGVRALRAQPSMYVSAESHHSLLKAARLCGIGTEAVREIEVDGRLRMKPEALAAAVAKDRAAGYAPFLAVATAGTTNAGVIDPLAECAAVAERERIWFHVDAAWGGGAAFVPELRPLLDGIERADSITFDAHKWLSVPMGAGIFLTRREAVLDRTFRTETAYMPREAKGLDVVDPHLQSMQWSRRFTGAKVFLALLAAGWEGYTEAIRRQTRMGELLLERLRAGRSWRVENETPLPVVCFTDPGGADASAIAMRVVSSGEAWISTTTLAGNTTALRACITNFLTGEDDVEALVASLDSARRHVTAGAARSE